MNVSVTRSTKNYRRISINILYVMFISNCHSKTTEESALISCMLCLYQTDTQKLNIQLFFSEFWKNIVFWDVI